tara:strand:- start:415 stop:753 length:339 start_codon:yes stop_codon:yes gene_type:complete
MNDLLQQKFRAFLKNGFISVRAKSGKVYQIFPGHDITCVFEQGKMIERLCVVLKGNFPPTDQLIVRYLILLNDEEKFRSIAVKNPGVLEQNTNQQADMLTPLPILFKRLKAA